MVQRRKLQTSIHLTDTLGNLTTTGTGATVRLIRHGGRVNETKGSVGSGDTIDVDSYGALKVGDWVRQWKTSTKTLSDEMLLISAITAQTGASDKDWRITFSDAQPDPTDDIDFSIGDRLVLDYDPTNSPKVEYYDQEFKGSPTDADITLGTTGEIEKYLHTNVVDIYVYSATIGHQYITNVPVEGEISGCKTAGTNVTDVAPGPTTWETWQIGTLKRADNDNVGQAIRVMAFGIYTVGSTARQAVIRLKIGLEGAETTVVTWTIAIADVSTSTSYKWRLEADFIPFDDSGTDKFDISYLTMLKKADTTSEIITKHSNMDATSISIAAGFDDVELIMKIEGELQSGGTGNTLDYSASVVQITE